MRLDRVISKRFRTRRKGIDVAGDVNVQIAGNVGEGGATTTASHQQSNRIVQTSPRKQVGDEPADEETRR
jgi:hypothetical protein